jgi:tetratricopeptide (TPR) repeat protein
LSEHLTAAELEAVLGDEEISPERRREVGCHLARRCETCQAVLATILPGQVPISPEEDDAYDRAITSSFQWALRLERHRKDEENQLRAAAILAFGKGPVAIAEKGDMPLEGLGVYRALLERSWAVRHDNPREMVTLAKTATYLAKNLDPVVYDEAEIADYQSRAWGELGNAQRVANDLWEAQRSFGEAFKLLENGTGDLLLKARLHDLYASLLAAQRNFDFAIDGLDVVQSLYLEAGDSHLAGRTLILKAVYTHRSGRSAEAIKINKDGLAQIDEQREPGLTAWALHNQVLYLEACGRYSDAKRLLFENRSRLVGAGRVNELKLRWAEGRIDLGLKKFKAAGEAFIEVKAGFLETEQGFAGALVSMELALAWMYQGKTAEARSIVMEAARVFSALEIHREVLGAVQLLNDAFRIDRASVVLVERVVSFLREWEINPDARFMPAPE